MAKVMASLPVVGFIIFTGTIGRMILSSAAIVFFVVVVASHKMGLFAGGAAALSDSCEFEWKGSASASRLDLEGGAGNFLSCSKVA